MGFRAKILVDDRWVGDHGIGRFSREVISRLGEVESISLQGSPVNPFDPIRVSTSLYFQRPGVYFSPGFNPPLFASVPFVFTIHDLNHLVIRANSSSFKRAYYRHFIKPACFKAFKVLTVSEFSRRSLIEWSDLDPGKVVNVGNGVDPIFDPKGEAHSPGYEYFLYIGNQKPHKNIPRLLEAYARVSARHDVRLMLSGFSDKEVMRLAISLGIENKLVFSGYVEDRELPKYYRGALALVFPSLYEGFGLPVLEAMACGTPVITSDVAAMPEVAGDAALLVHPERVSEIENAMLKVIEDPLIRQQMRAAGLARATRFSWDLTADRVRKVLAEALEES